MMDILAAIAARLLIYFNLVMFMLAVIAILINRYSNKKTSNADIVYRWVAFFGIGVPYLYAFIIHLFFKDLAVATIGYTPSPYHDEIAALDLFYAICAFCTFNARFGYRLAFALISTCLLWTDVAARMNQLMVFHEYVLGSEATALFLDFAIPVILLLCARKLKLK